MLRLKLSYFIKNGPQCCNFLLHKSPSIYIELQNPYNQVQLRSVSYGHIASFFTLAPDAELRSHCWRRSCWVNMISSQNALLSGRTDNLGVFAVPNWPAGEPPRYKGAFDSCVAHNCDVHCIKSVPIHTIHMLGTIVVDDSNEAIQIS